MMLDRSHITRALPPGSMRYFAWLYTPTEYRDVVAALFVIEAELHDSARAPHEVAHHRLQWWREEIDQLIAGKARHPATQVLQSHARQSIDFQPLHTTLLSTAQELANSTYETDAELVRYFQGGLGTLLATAMHYLSPNPSSAALDAATQLGAFIRHAEVIRDLRQDLHQGRLFLPLAQLDELNLDYEILQSITWPEPFIELLKTRCAQSLNQLKTLKNSLLRDEKKALRPLLVLAELHAALLHQISTDPVTYTQQRLELKPLSKLWTAWRTARMAR